MQTDFPFSLEELYNFIIEAGENTYAAGAPPVTSERPDFIEYEYAKGDFSYRDSYTGNTKARGMEVVRYNGKPVWTSQYGGGMLEGNENLQEECYGFLKKALSDKKEYALSFRGPELLNEGDWEYSYKQTGDIYEFDGYEEIKYKGEPVFFHKAIGGAVI